MKEKWVCFQKPKSLLQLQYVFFCSLLLFFTLTRTQLPQVTIIFLRTTQLLQFSNFFSLNNKLIWAYFFFGKSLLCYSLGNEGKFKLFKSNNGDVKVERGTKVEEEHLHFTLRRLVRGSLALMHHSFFLFFFLAFSFV